MISKVILMVTFLGAVATLCCGTIRSPGNAETKPNFVVILTNDQRADAMDCSGNPHFDDVVFFKSNGFYYGWPVWERKSARTVEGRIDEYVAGQAIAFLGQASTHEKSFALLICPQVLHMDNHFRCHNTVVDANKMNNLAGVPQCADTIREIRAEFVYRCPEATGTDGLPPPAQIDAAFPGGNIIVERIDGDHVTLRPDLRDTTRWWFYWYFRARRAAGRTISFEFAGPNPIGVHGPAVSTDGGRSWSWLGAAAASEGAFTFSFPPTCQEARFAFTIPYVEMNLQRFLQPLRADAHLKITSLTRTSMGREVQALYLGRLDNQAKYHVLLTARHHACEAMASYALEGLIKSVLQDRDQRWLREHVAFLVVPFMDKDGVEQGDQGKLRAPHDHNRDYVGTSIYPSVAALRDRVPTWADGKLRIALDLHCPFIRGERNESIYFVGLPDQQIWHNVGRFSTILESLPPTGLPFHAKDNLPFGEAWNTGSKLGEGTSMARWTSKVPGIELAATVEIPYANIGDTQVTPDSARAFGRDLAGAIRRFLQQGDPEAELKE